MRKIFFILVLLFLTYLAANANAAIDVSIPDGNAFLDFGSVNSGDSITLSEKGGYHHSIVCTSNTGNTWYLKLSVVKPFTFGTRTIPMENFSLTIEQLVNGKGSVNGGLNRDIPIMPTTTLIYTSANEDNAGTQIEFKIYYKLNIPKNQVAGNYTAHLQYTISEKI